MLGAGMRGGNHGWGGPLSNHTDVCDSGTTVSEIKVYARQSRGRSVPNKNGAANSVTSSISCGTKKIAVVASSMSASATARRWVLHTQEFLDTAKRFVVESILRPTLPSASVCQGTGGFPCAVLREVPTLREVPNCAVLRIATLLVAGGHRRKIFLFAPHATLVLGHCQTQCIDDVQGIHGFPAKGAAGHPIFAPSPRGVSFDPYSCLIKQAAHQKSPPPFVIWLIAANTAATWVKFCSRWIWIRHSIIC